MAVSAVLGCHSMLHIPSMTSSRSDSQSQCAVRTKKAKLSKGFKRLRPCLWAECGAAAGLGLLMLPSSCWAAQDGLGALEWIEQLLAEEPTNALSLPTWTIHVASVVEWVVAMILVWQYGDTEKNAAWKGLSWGMVPLLGGALCACTWHFFYNAESLEGLVVLQGALTLIGNFTLWIAAFRIFQSAQEKSS